MTIGEKNPPLSGNSEEGSVVKLYTNIPSIHNIAYPLNNFNSMEKFNMRMLQNVRGSGGQYTALCPAHDDRNSSLSIKIDNDKVLLHCHAGCAVEDILAKLDLPMSALFLGDDREKNPKPTSKGSPRQINTITYDYQNPDGTLAYRKVRYEYNDGSKSFAFFTPDGKKGVAGLQRVPYNLPAVLAADTVYFVEGEKAANAVIGAGYVATSLDAGAKSRWLPEYTAFFEGRNIVILPDNDTPGINYALSIASNLPGSIIKILPDMPEKGDVYDWLADGRTMEEIETLPPVELNERVQGQVSLAGAPAQARIGAEPQGLNLNSFLPSEPGFIAINPFETAETKNRYRWNDIGISNLFADSYKDVSRYVPEANAWYTYDGRVWKQDVGGVAVANQAKRFMYHLLITCQRFITDEDTRGQWVEFVSKRMKKQARDTMIADAASCWPVSILAFDRDPFVFNCLNCTIDLRTFKAQGHNPGDFLSKVSGVTYDERARCERWDVFIDEIMRGDNETARFLQKALGYALTGDTSEECFFILYGSTTRNGKGTCMETTLHLLGDYGRTAQPETIAQKQITHSGGPTEDIARLKGARFINMSEPDKGLRLNSALVKQMTGGDTVTARFLHQNSFEFTPEYKLFINTNHLPRVSDDTIFASGRVKLIPFERHFEESEQDKGLKAFFKQEENVSGIFNWFLDGLRLMQAEGLEQPPAVKTATDQYREESDVTGQFIADCLIGAKGMETKADDVYKEYKQWCEECGYGIKAARTFYTDLRAKGIKVERTRQGQTIYEYALVYKGEVPTGF